MALEINLEDLVAAAAQVGGHGEDLAVRHGDADARLHAAAPGWAGRSATALSARAARWAVTSTALLTRAGEHAAALHSSAITFAAAEQHRADGYRAL